jgi:hypothetical protein
MKTEIEKSMEISTERQRIEKPEEEEEEEIIKESETLEREIVELRERQQLREEIERERLEISELKTTVQEVLIRTKELRGRSEIVIEEMKTEIEKSMEISTERERIEKPEEEMITETRIHQLLRKMSFVKNHEIEIRIFCFYI